MGAGIAREVRDRFKGIDKAIGTYINSLGIETEKGYGLLLSPNGGKVGAFQTKIHYKDESPLWLIRKSTDMLREYAESNPHIIISIPYPGIGHGNRSIEEIKPSSQYCQIMFTFIKTVINKLHKSTLEKTK